MAAAELIKNSRREKERGEFISAFDVTTGREMEAEPRGRSEGGDHRTTDHVTQK
jgi:hypothetical protein